MKAAVCNNLKPEYLRRAVVCWGFAHCGARTDVRHVTKSTSVREELLLAQVPKCPLFCHYSLQLFHSVDFEIESSIDLQLSIKLSKYVTMPKLFAVWLNSLPALVCGLHVLFRFSWGMLGDS